MLLVLLRLGSATTLRLAKVADVPRTSTYQVLEDLRAKGLAVQVPGDGAAVWASPGRDEVMDLLDAAEEERLAEHKARTARIRQLIAESFPESPSMGLPSVQLLASAAQMMAVFEQLLAEAEREFLMFARPPTPGSSATATRWCSRRWPGASGPGCCTKPVSGRTRPRGRSGRRWRSTNGPGSRSA